MSFQQIINSATAISIDKNPIISQTLTRDQTIRQTSRGGAIYRFSVTPSPGWKWRDYRWLIAFLEEGRIGTQNISINKAGHEWINPLDTELTTPQFNQMVFLFTADQQALNPRQIALTNLPAVSSGTTILHAGNIIQSANSPFPYTVTGQVLRGTGDYAMVPIHRVCLDTPSFTTYAIKAGPTVTWRVAMTRMPRWTITSDRLIAWDGNFEFTESLLP